MTLSKYIINGILLDTAIDIVNDNINDIVVLLTGCEITRLVATIHFYSPQRGKVMFLHVSVILFTVSPSRGFSIPGGLCPGGVLCHGFPPYGNERAVHILLECILVHLSVKASKS